MDENVTAIVPAFNEGDRIGETIAALQQIEEITQIIAVNDGSTDNTYEVLKKLPRVHVVSYPKNHGKGYAIKAALPYVSNNYVLLVDADLKSSAAEMRKLVENCNASRMTMLVAVYPKPLKKGGFGLVKNLTQKSLYMLTAKTSDSVLSGQRLLPADFLRQIDIPDNFGLEFKITLEALRRNIEIVNIPLDIRHRETGRDFKGFVHRGKQFFDIIKVVVRELI